MPIVILFSVFVNAQSTYTTNRNPVGLEYNLLFNADTYYTVTQPGSFEHSNIDSFFDGKLTPLYSSAQNIPTLKRSRRDCVVCNRTK